jgi:hypothetical protein
MTHQVFRRGVGTLRRYGFVMPSTLQGVGSVVDIAGTAELSNYRLHPTPKASDAKGLRSDWQTVGDHLRRAMELEGERPTKP